MAIRWPPLQLQAALLLALSLTIAPAGADEIRVGPLASGCTHADLAGAFLAAAVSSGSDTIIITTNQTWTGGGALNLTSESQVTIRGGLACSDITTALRTVTMTNGDLFEFVNTSATLRDLLVLSDPGGGRAVTAAGAGSVIVLENITLNLGKASDGGNVHLSDGASLAALDGARILGGVASFNGGGVYCTGPGVVGLGAGSQVSANRADFNGGGVYATVGCTVNVLSGGPLPILPDQFAGVYDNRAFFDGGGIYATSGATVNVAGSSATPASIRDNTADFFGGGIYLTGAGTTGFVLSSEIVDNRGFRGGGGLLVTAGATLEMDRDLAVCERGIRCSLLAGNATASLTGETTEGGAITVQGGGNAEIRQTYLTENGAANNAHVALVDGAGSFLLIEGSVLFDNDPRGTHVTARGGGHARLAYTSIWGSSASGFGMFLLQAEASSRIDLYSSIVIEGNGSAPTGGGSDKVFATPGAGGTHNADCVITHEQTSFPPDPFGTTSLETNPGLIWLDPQGGDSHLRSDAAAIDYCDAFTYTPVDLDLDNETRGTDGPPPINLGFFDLGADEWNASSSHEIFLDRFESGNTSAWTSTTP